MIEINIRDKMYCANQIQLWLSSDACGKYSMSFPYIYFDNDEDATAFVLMFPDKPYTFKHMKIT